MEDIMINTSACDGSDIFYIWIAWLLAAFLLGIAFGWFLKKRKEDTFIDVSDLVSPKAKKFDDLTAIEGIGKKIQELLNHSKITSYEDLANASQETLKRILTQAGPAYSMHKPITWSAQAKLASEQEWTELKKWQKQLKGGV